MTKEEAYEENRRLMEPFLFSRDPEDPAASALHAVLAELTSGTEHPESVGRSLDDPRQLVRLLTAPTQVVWSEPGEGEKRDPVSGAMRPVTVTRSAAGAGAAELHEIKCRFAAFARAMAARAKAIGSPAYMEIREVCIALERWSARHGGLRPMDETAAAEAVERLNEALFDLWVDAGIEEAGRHG